MVSSGTAIKTRVYDLVIRIFHDRPTRIWRIMICYPILWDLNPDLKIRQIMSGPKSKIWTR